MKTPQGLTNTMTLKGGIITKTSSPAVDYFLNRSAEASLYQQLKDQPPTNFYLQPLSWGFDAQQNFTSDWTYLPDSYTLSDRPELLGEQATLEAMVQVIQSYHRLEVEMPTFEPRIYLDKFVQKLQNPLVDLTPYQTKLNTIIDHFFEPEFPVCLSHNDMVPSNFLFVNGELKLIDFEYSLKNLELFDYAGVISETLPFEQIKPFVDLLDLDLNQKDKLRDLIFYAYILWINWSNYMYEATNKKVYADLVAIMYDKLKNFASLPF